jgi:hypothetical protein
LRPYPQNTVTHRSLSYAHKTPPKYPSYANKTMRPLKYQHLGEMIPQRIPSRVSNVLPRLMNVMNTIEERGEDCEEVINTVLDQLEDN